MKMNRMALWSVLIVLTTTFLGIGAGAMGSLKGNAWAQSAKSADLKMTIIGKIMQNGSDYYIQGETPREVFTILNPNPEVLREMAASGQTVTIEGKSVVGDNLNIERINGKEYQSK